MHYLKTLGQILKMANFQSASARQKIKRINSQSGVSLIELMVAMVIGLVVSLAIYGVLNANEGRRRTTTSTNDIDQSGAYTIYQFSKIIRSAGSGFGGTSNTILSPSGNAFGCGLLAAQSGTAVLPAASFPAPFAAVATAANAAPAKGIRLAPVIIFPSAATSGDVLMVMSGSGGLSEALTDFSAKPTVNSLTMTSLAGFRANDIILVTDSAGGLGAANCMVEQVSSTFVPSATSLALPLAGTYYTANVGTNTLISYSASTPNPTSSALNLGQSPVFNMFGVGANNTLFSYDLLSPANAASNTAGANPSVFADNVYAMYAIYGVDDDGNPATTTLNWKLPTDANYTPAKLLAGTAAANALLQTIKAVKVGIIMQSALPEKQAVIASPGVTYTGANATVKLFSDTPAATQITRAVTPTNVRYRVFEVTIPIRNSLIIPN
jgi:type IV pilus assembly protein PilW